MAHPYGTLLRMNSNAKNRNIIVMMMLNIFNPFGTTVGSANLFGA